MTQPPVRFENYPPDETATPDGSAEKRTPDIRPYVPDPIPPPDSGGGTGRRTLIGLAIGIPVLLIGFTATRSAGNSMWDPMPGGPMDEPSDEPASADDPEDGPSEETIDVGGRTATVPDGWTVNDDGSTVELSKGANRLTAVSFDTGTSTLAVDEIAHLAKGHYAGFKGKIGDPVDRSSAELQHATMDGTGKFSGKAARLMVELWIDDEGSGLLISLVLTAKVASAIAIEAQGILQELSGGF